MAIKGLEKISSFNFLGIASGLGKILLLIFLLVLVAVIVGVFLYKKKEKELYKEKIHYFEEVNGQMVPIDDLTGAELTIPNTNIKVFYIKSQDYYLPRGTRKMGKNAYWYAIRQNKEIVNFTMKNLNKDMIEAGLDYDHTDMRYADENLKEILKRNYKDKSVKWWKEYKDVIATVIFVFVMSLSFFFMFSQVGKLLGSISPLLDRATEILTKLTELEQSCGVLKESSGVIKV